MNDLYHNLNFFRAAIQAYKANFLNAVLVAATLLAIEWAAQFFDMKYLDSFLLLMFIAAFAYAIHYTILFGDKLDTKTLFTGKEINRFFWRSLIFQAVFLAAMFGVSLAVFAGLGDRFDAQTLKGTLILLTAIIGLPLFGASFAIWGTMLPATVAGEDASFNASWQRAKGNFWYTFLRLVIGPFFATLALQGLVFLLVYLKVPVDYFTAEGAFNFIGLLVSLALQMAGLLITALAASVLCKTYLRSRTAVPVTVA